MADVWVMGCWKRNCAKVTWLLQDQSLKFLLIKQTSAEWLRAFGNLKMNVADVCAIKCLVLLPDFSLFFILFSFFRQWDVSRQDWISNKAGLKVRVFMCWSCIWFWIQRWWRLDLDERAADICGSWALEGGLDWNLPQSTPSSFRAAAAPQLRKPSKHLRTTSTGASGGRRVQEQHIKIIKCYQMCVCSISLVGVKILSGPARAHSRLSILFIWTSLATRSRLPSLLIAQATPCSQGSNGQHFYVNIPLFILESHSCCVLGPSQPSYTLNFPAGTSQAVSNLLFILSKSGWCHLCRFTAAFQTA